MNVWDYSNMIDEAISSIKCTLSTLNCVRISVKGNGDVIPSPETIDDALFSIESVIDEELEKISNANKKLFELERAV